MSTQGPSVTVIDMQPIEPAVGGGRARLLGLYHGLGLSTTYVGTFDWPGEALRDLRLSPTLRELDVPLSAEHFAAAEAARQRVGGKTVIDAAFHTQAHLSPAYVDAIRREAAAADIVVLSHPWCYPLVRDVLVRERQLLVYDAHNVESYLKFLLLDDEGGPGSQVVRALTAVEHRLCREADLMLTCSAEDRDLFHALYRGRFGAMRVIPNGVFTSRIVPTDANRRRAARRELGIRHAHAALFLGSGYAPNAEAATFIVHQLAPRLPGVLFLLAGGVSTDLGRGPVPPNVRAFGVVDESTKQRLLHAADVAVNPMFGGSGTAVKMFDFMAAALPVVSTPVGARGIVERTGEGVVVAPATSFVQELGRLLSAEPHRAELGGRNRRLVEDRFSWERISANLGHLLTGAWQERRQAEPDQGLAPGVAHGGRGARVAMLTTWNIRCGIAEYARAFSGALTSQGAEVLTLANSRGGPGDAGEQSATEDGVVFAWDYDQVRFRDSRIHVRRVVGLLEARSIRHVSIQHHPGFYPVAALRELVAACRERRISTCVTLHNSRLMALDDLRALASEAEILTLNQDELVRLGNGGVRAGYLPLGVEEVALSPRTASSHAGARVLGTFGFIRAHKGLLPLIEAAGHLAARAPGLTLRAYTSLYPSEDSHRYHRQCLELIERRGLAGTVQLVTEYLPIDDLRRNLHACDLVVLPYDPSDEGASAAAATAIAAKVPLAVSTSSIFDEIRDVAHTLESCEPRAMATELEGLLGNQGRLERLATLAKGYVRQASWRSVAERYLGRYLPGEVR